MILYVPIHTSDLGYNYACMYGHRVIKFFSFSIVVPSVIGQQETSTIPHTLEAPVPTYLHQHQHQQQQPLVANGYNPSCLAHPGEYKTCIYYILYKG